MFVLLYNLDVYTSAIDLSHNMKRKSRKKDEKRKEPATLTD
jgi:hypothetical protein